MAAYLEEFIEYFNLDAFFGNSVLTVQMVLGYSITAFIGVLITLMGIRCIVEILKILFDWSNFR